MAGGRRPGVNPQTSLVSETLFPDFSLRDRPRVTGPPFLLFPEINTFARPYPAARSTPASRPLHFLDERISPPAFALYLTRN